MKTVSFEIYETEDGDCPFQEWLTSLPPKDAAKLLQLIKKVQEQGIPVALKMQWVKKLDNDIWELRSQLANNIQRALYFQKIGNIYIITHGFTKKTQKTPPREIERAREIMKLYQQEKKG